MAGVVFVSVELHRRGLGAKHQLPLTAFVVKGAALVENVLRAFSFLVPSVSSDSPLIYKR